MEQFAAEVKARAPKNEAPRPGLVVVPVLDAATVTGHKKELYRSMVSVAGRSLPFGKETDPGNTRQWLVAQHPHFAAEIDIVLRQPRPLRLLLVGAPGGGKTTFARDLGEAVDLPDRSLWRGRNVGLVLCRNIRSVV